MKLHSTLHQQLKRSLFLGITLTVLGGNWNNIEAQCSEFDVTLTTVEDHCQVACVKAYDYYNNYAFILPALPGQENDSLGGRYIFDGDSTGIFSEFGDGTAHLIGTIVSKGDTTKKLDVDIWFNDKQPWEDWQNYSNESSWKGQHDFVGENYTNWDYYLIDSGYNGKKSKLTGTAGGFYEGYEFYIEHQSNNNTIAFAFQIGQAANDKPSFDEANYGCSAWFSYTGIDPVGKPVFGGLSDLGDLNVDFCEQCTGSATLDVMTTNSFTVTITPAKGVIVTQNNSTIKLDSLCPGSYKVEVIDSSGCSKDTIVNIESIDCNKTPIVQFCTFNQSHYGNSSDSSDSSQELVNELLYEGDVTIGLAGYSLTIKGDEAACVMTLLPGAGPVKTLPEGDHILAPNCTPIMVNTKKIKVDKKGRINNTLAAQAITLTLNTRLDKNLGELVLEENSFTTQLPTENTTFCYSIPASVLTVLGDNNTVDKLLHLANTALGNGDIIGTNLGDITTALGAINHGFDECRYLVGFDSLSVETTAKNIAAKPNLQLYPVPTYTTINTSFISTTRQQATIEVYDVAGRKVITSVASVFEGDNMQKLNINDLTPGIYLVNVMLGDKQDTKKFTKMH